MSLAAFFRERILGPLGMMDTGFTLAEANLSRLAGAYRRIAAGTLVPAMLLHEGRVARYDSGGGGLLSTTPDYLRFAHMLLSGGELDGVRLLGTKTVEMMTTNQLGPGVHPFGRGSVGYGFGVSVTSPGLHSLEWGSPGGYGWFGIAGTRLIVDPCEELVLLLMVQQERGAWHRLLHEFSAVAYQAIVG